LTFHAAYRRDHARLAFIYASAIVLIAAGASWKSAPRHMVGLHQYYFLSRGLLAWAMLQTVLTPGWPRIVFGAILGWSVLVSIPDLQSPIKDLHWSEQCRLIDSPGKVQLYITDRTLELENPDSSRSQISEEVLATDKAIDVAENRELPQPLALQ